MREEAKAMQPQVNQLTILRTGAEWTNNSFRKRASYPSHTQRSRGPDTGRGGLAKLKAAGQISSVDVEKYSENVIQPALLIDLRSGLLSGSSGNAKFAMQWVIARLH